MIPLDAKGVRQVLRYWLAAVRQEEALADRPRARRPVRGTFALDLIEPRPGTPYFKLAASPATMGFLFLESPALEQPVDPERQAFLSHWLRVNYAREAAEKFGRTDPRGQAIHVGWPVVHARRSGELCCVLKTEGSLAWLDAQGEAWAPPSYKERRARALPPPPTRLRIEVPPDRGDAPPFFVDTQLLGRTLGVTDEELQAFFAATREASTLSPAGMVTALCELLEAEGEWSPPLADVDEGAAPSDLFARLLAAVRRRLPPGEAAYPVALVTDDSRVYASWHLQKDLLALLRHPPGKGPWGEDSAVWHYLSGTPAAAGRVLPRGLYARRPLTAGQRATAERFLGSTLTAAQGPPGTGKTDLVLNLAADTLIHRLRPLLESRAMGRGQLVVTSTNNRAVDNVLDPLGRDTPADRLPLGLRVGNQHVSSGQGAEMMFRCRGWLQQQDPAQAEAIYETAIEGFEQCLAAVDAALAAYERALGAEKERASLRGRIADLDEEIGEAPATATAVELALRRLKPLRRLLRDLEHLTATRTEKAPIRAARHWDRRCEKKGVLTELTEALEPLGMELCVHLPPEAADFDDAFDLLDEWEDRVEEAADAADILRDRLLVMARAHTLAAKRRRLEQALADLEDLGPLTGPPPDLVLAQHRLYIEAAGLREAWAMRHRSQLIPALESAGEHLSRRAGGLRALFEKDRGVSTWIERLFPVLGCTLLSLGNVLPPEPKVAARVVVDEAGQCHPAYALAALMRAERALVIGDVHQLEPVVRLGALDDQRVRRAEDIDLADELLEPYVVHDRQPNSAQALADRAVPDRPALRDHFRCQPAIIAVSDRLCDYQLNVRTPARSLAARVQWLAAPLIVAPVEGQQERVRGSWANPAEANAVVQLLMNLARRGIGWGEVAVLTPYVGQLDLLRQRLRDAGVPIDADREAFSATQDMFDTGSLATGTVHRFQGGERTVVIFSTVVTREASLAFLNQRVNLVNVAVSRARDHLVVVGMPAVLSQGRNTAALVDRAISLADLPYG